MEQLILVALVVLIILVAILMLRKPSDVLSDRIDADINRQFLEFQSEIHSELDSTRSEVGRSKDIMSEHTVKTLDTIRGLGDTIGKIVEQQEEAQKLGQSLRDILQAPKLRGNYGEAVLEEMLERVLPQGIWQTQYLIEGREKVDAVVRYRDIVVPIDAKFPRDDYLKYLEADSPEEKATHWRDYETALKIQIRSISSKYVKLEEGTSDFALMFIPSEATYYETIAEKNHLGQPSSIYEYAQDHKVIPVSPNTFYAFLQIIIHGIRNMEIITSARKLQEGLKTIERSFDFFYKKYESIGTNIENASEAYRIGNDHIQRFKRRLDSTLQLEQLQEIGDGVDDLET